MRRRPSPRALIACLLLTLALGLRVGEVARTSYRPVNDAGFYLSLASHIAHTGDYSTSHAPGSGAGGTHGPTAYFPPAFPYFLAAVDLIDGHTGPRGGAVTPARYSQALLGTAIVGLLGLVGLEAFGPVVALVALGLGAIYPVLIELSGALVAENLLTALVLAAVYATLRARRSTRPYGWIAGAGLLTGLAMLTHVNAIVVLAPVLVGALSARPTISSLGVLLGVWALTLLPWTLRNESLLHRFVPVSDETGITLVGTYNSASAADHRVPYRWRLYDAIPGERALVHESSQLSEPALSDRLRSQALHYIGRHPGAPIAVAFHNSLRLLELDGSFAWRASAASIDIPEGTAKLGVVAFWILCLLALASVPTRLARRAPGWIWFAPGLLWLSVALVNAETPRFREPVDPFLILLAACGLVTAGGAGLTRWRAGLARRREGRSGGAPVA